MNKYLAHISFSMVGCDTYKIIEAKSADEAWQMAYEDSVDWAQSYGFEQNEEVFGDLDTVGCDWDEDEGCYAQEGFIDPSVELYDPEKHDGLF